MRIMMWLWVCMALILFGTATAAQSPILHVPSPEEYLRAIPEATRRWLDNTPRGWGKASADPIANALYFELDTRYTPEEYLNNLPVKIIAGAYQALQDLKSINRDNNPPLSWFEAVIEEWVASLPHEYPLDLTTFPILDATIQISIIGQADFNRDGRDEVIVFFRSSYHQAYVLLHPIESGYQLANIVTSSETDPYMSSGTDIKPLELRDLTGDGNPEWLIQYDYSLPFNMRTCSAFNIYTWHEGGLRAAIEGDTNLCDAYNPTQGLTFSVNPSGAQTITIQEPIPNDWDCDTYNLRRFEWVAPTFVMEENADHDAPTPECQLYRAETHTINHTPQLAIAIPYYEQALALWASTSPTDDRAKLRQVYAQTRLIIAYTLTGQFLKARQAQQTLGEMDTTFHVSPILDFAEAMVDAKLTRYDVCSTAYGFWFDYGNSGISIYVYDEETIGIMIGRLVSFGGMMDSAPPFPSSSGCDMNMWFPPPPLPYQANPTYDNRERQLTYYSQEIGDALLFEVAQHAYDFLVAADPVAALTAIDSALENHIPTAQPMIVDGLRYWRALSLEQSGRLDAALAEYVALSQAGDDSPWAVLAAIHIR